MKNFVEDSSDSYVATAGVQWTRRTDLSVIVLFCSGTARVKFLKEEFVMIIKVEEVEWDRQSVEFVDYKQEDIISLC